MRSDRRFTVPATPQQTTYIAGHSLWVVAPVLRGSWSYLGEPNKIVKASARRVTSLNSNGESLIATLLLAPREIVTVAMLSPHDEILHATCVGNGTSIPAAYDGDTDVSVTLTCEGASCECQQ